MTKVKYGYLDPVPSVDEKLRNLVFVVERLTEKVERLEQRVNEQQLKLNKKF